MRRITLATAAAASLLLIAALSACAPDDPAPTAGPDVTTAAPVTQTPPATPTPTMTAEVVEVPTDCRQILSDDVLAQLADVPLNDPAFGATGVQTDGSLVCVWGDPAADTTNLSTTISLINRGPALDELNAFRDKGATCYTPDGGTRCERSWKNAQYPVTDGRTMFWRDGLMIDTRYSNLAPDGYTSSIIAHVFG